MRRRIKVLLIFSAAMFILTSNVMAATLPVNFDNASDYKTYFHEASVPNQYVQTSSGGISGGALIPPTFASYCNDSARLDAPLGNATGLTQDVSIMFRYDSTLRNVGNHNTTLELALQPKTANNALRARIVDEAGALSFVLYSLNNTNAVPVTLADGHWYQMDFTVNNVGGQFGNLNLSATVSDYGTTGLGSPGVIATNTLSIIDGAFSFSPSLELRIFSEKWGGAAALDNFSAVVRPIADAGVDQNAWNQKSVTLDGSHSFILGNQINYTWTQVSGPSVTLSDPTIVNPTFVAPTVGADTDLDFRLVVKDVQSNETGSPDDVIIHVINDIPPVANAGPDISVSANSTVHLNGSGSTDSDGSIIQYEWRRMPDNTVLCAGASPTCDIKSLGRSEELIQLKVTDNAGAEGTDKISIFYHLPSICGNSVVENGEVCDSNSQSCTATGGYPGTMSCNNQCSGFNACVSTQSCGDNIKNGNEICDGNSQNCTTVGGYAGTQSCNSQCTGYNTCATTLSCGDHIINGSEVCDGSSQACTTASGYAGNQTCNSQCTGYNTCTTTLSCGDGVCSTPETNATCPQDCPSTFAIVLEAENMPTKTNGKATTGGWIISSNGYIEGPVQFPKTGIYKFDIIAYGSVALGVWPNMDMRIDQSAKASFTVNATSWTTYTVQINVTQGTHNVAIAFTNDFHNTTEDRNLYVDKVTITGQ